MNAPSRPRPEVGVAAEPGPIGEPTDWVALLGQQGPAQDVALQELHHLMLRAARHQVRRMGGLLPGRGPEFLDDVANTAADEALTQLLRKLHTFEGRSRFTTWAYKFAILQAATEVRRHAWTGREVPLDDLVDRSDPTADPSRHAEAVDLQAAVNHAMAQVLTPYQRKIALSLLVDQVPIDVLAERLGTTRGALYKALHDVRLRLRQHLRDTGFLSGGTAGRGDAGSREQR